MGEGVRCLLSNNLASVDQKEMQNIFALRFSSNHFAKRFCTMLWLQQHANWVNRSMRIVAKGNANLKMQKRVASTIPLLQERQHHIHKLR